MNLRNKPYTSLWYDTKTQVVSYIDQTKLPWELCIKQLNSLDDAIRAIKNMEVRGAPLIGVTAAFGFAIALRNQLNSPTNPTPHTPKPQATKHQATTPQATNHQATKPPSHQATKLPSHQATKPPSPQATIYNLLLSTRPTAINLKWALDQMLESLQIPSERSELQSHGEQSEPPIPREAKSHG